MTPAGACSLRPTAVTSCCARSAAWSSSGAVTAVLPASSWYDGPIWSSWLVLEGA